MNTISFVIVIILWELKSLMEKVQAVTGQHASCNNNSNNDNVCCVVIIAQSHCESSSSSYDEYGM